MTVLTLELFEEILDRKLDEKLEQKLEEKLDQKLDQKFRQSERYILHKVSFMIQDVREQLSQEILDSTLALKEFVEAGCVSKQEHERLSKRVSKLEDRFSD